MKLEYLDDLTDGGKYNPSIVQLVRLYDFDEMQACKLAESIKRTIISNHEMLDLTKLPFIEALNCKILLRLADEEVGLNTSDKQIFYCDLTIKGFQYMVQIIEIFCTNGPSGYHWLYDTWENPDLSEIEFLFSPGGTW